VAGCLAVIPGRFRVVSTPASTLHVGTNYEVPLQKGGNRDDIIGKITEDAKRLQATVNPQCKIEIHGLPNRVSWQRSDISQLTLYIPYQVQLNGCQ